MKALFGVASVLLCRIDDTEYLALRAVYACRGDEPPALYCLESEWAATPMARIASLQSRVAQLEADLALALDATVARPPRAPENGKIPCDHPGCLDWIKPRGMAQHKRQAHGIGILGMAVPTPAPAAADERRKCPHCNQRPKVQGMQEHIAREHQPHEPMMEIANDLGWRCAEKGCAGAFTRDLHDPTHCTRHTSRSTNGHTAAVLS